MQPVKNNKNIAIIGSGISGLSAAFFLRNHHNVTIYEKNGCLGGHSRTIEISHSGENIKVDTGFIVLNDRTYPNLNQLFSHLEIPLIKTEMSFSASINEGELEWAGSSLDTWFAQRKNIFNCKMWGGMFDILKFNKHAINLVRNHPELLLRDLIKFLKLGDWFQNYYLLPMGGAIWSCSTSQILDFPARTFIEFCENHGLLSISNRPQWYSLKNKSIDYVTKLHNILSENTTIYLSSNISKIERTETNVIITNNSKEQIFDEVIFACNASEAIKLIHNQAPEETSILSKFKTQKNTAYTHRDIKQMPKIKKCWSSWNYLSHKQHDSTKIAVSYWMNKLQAIDEKFPIFVTLNPIYEIKQDMIFDIAHFEHPIFDINAISAQAEIENIQGKNRTWFCGAYLKYGFHEDGITSAIALMKKMGVNLPW